MGKTARLLIPGRVGWGPSRLRLPHVFIPKAYVQNASHPAQSCDPAPLIGGEGGIERRRKQDPGTLIGTTPRKASLMSEIDHRWVYLCMAAVIFLTQSLLSFPLQLEQSAQVWCLASIIPVHSLRTGSLAEPLLCTQEVPPGATLGGFNLKRSPGVGEDIFLPENCS